MKQSILLFTILLLSFGSLFTQPAIEWENTIGGTWQDYMQDVVITDDGGYLLCGESNSAVSGDKTEPSSGGDFWIIKVDLSGAIVWQKVIGGNDYDVCRSVAQTADGGFILGGKSYSGISGNKSEAHFGGGDFWVVKIDASGNVEWNKTLGGSDVEELFSVIQTIDGGYLLGGSSYSGISGNKTEPNLGFSDFYAVKLDASGNIEWQNTLGGADYDGIWSVCSAADGGYMLSGYSQSGLSDDKSEPSQGSYDYWVVKLNESGDIVWDNTIGGLNYEISRKIIPTNDGGFLIGGDSMSGISGDKTETNAVSDYWIIKIDTSGNIMWQNTIGGGGDDQFFDLLESADNGYLIGGYSKSNISFDKTEASLGKYDYWVVKTDASGIIQWQKTIGGSDDDYFRCLAQAADGGYLLGGFSHSPISGYKSEDVVGGFTAYPDYWIIRLSSESITCTTPVDLTTTATIDKAKVKWMDVDDALGYKVRYRMTGDSTWQIRYAREKTFAIIIGLTCNTNYEWQVLSICAADGSSHSVYSPFSYFTTAACRTENSSTADQFSIYPNPTSSVIYINLNEINYVNTIQIYNVTGIMMMETNILASADNIVKVDISSLENGMYFINLKGENETIEKTFIILR